jgi:8-amino-7-oxononanoate synthase
VTLDEHARDQLRGLEATHRLREPRVVDGLPGPRLVLDGADVLNLSSNDYLSLAGDARLGRAVGEAAERYGTGAGASRLIVGNHRCHVALEGAIADWLRRDGARVFASGYAANVGTLTALLGAGDVVVSDELNHASIVDGCRLSRAHIVVVPHRDLHAVEQALGRHAGRRVIVVSETLFSMDGDIADVRALSELCRRHDAALVLDEAHAIGARGPEGRGVAAAEGIVPDVLVGTCGKALGVSGAFVATTRAVADLLWNRARPFVFSTAISPMVCAAIETAIEIVRGADGDARRARLASNARTVRLKLACAESDSAIAPVVLRDDVRTMRVTAALLGRGLFVQGIRPPTVPEGTSRLRVSVSAGHDPEAIRDAAIAIVDEIRQASCDGH